MKTLKIKQTNKQNLREVEMQIKAVETDTMSNCQCLESSDLMRHQVVFLA